MTDRPRRTSPTPRRQTPPPTELPPIVAAVFRLAEPNLDGIPRDFIETYAAMPAVLATFLRGDEDKAGVAHLDSLITDISGFTKARAKAERNPDIDQGTPKGYDDIHDPARIIAILNRINADYPTDLTSPAGTAGLWVGIAFAAYVLTNGGAR